MDRKWRIELFGGLRVVQGQASDTDVRVITRFRTQKTAALLAYLAYYGNRSHPRETLIELLWPESHPKAGRNNLSKAVSSLRHQLEPPGVPQGAVLIADRYSLRLNPAAVTTDVAEFKRALQLATQAGSEDKRVQFLTAAVDLYHGELLHGFFEEWMEAERQRLADTYLNALRRLTRLLTQAGDLEHALDTAHRAVNVDPLREESHRDVMRLYAAVGRPAAALQQFHELERILKEELDDAPSASTCALAREVSSQLSVTSDQLPVTSGRKTVSKIDRKPKTQIPNPKSQAPTHPSSLIPHPSSNLPLQFTRFFGREEEMARLQKMLRSSKTRLVTLTGMGGSGKTRLAIEVVEQMKDEFAGGVWFVSLVDLADSRLILDAVRDALRLPRSPDIDPLGQVADALNRPHSALRSLLVLDNFEHLVTGGASVVLTLLKRVPALTILLTSRRRLAVAGERTFPVLPLPTPPQESLRVCELVKHLHQPTNPPTRTGTPEYLMSFPSVQLFVDRAQAASPDFQVTPRNAHAVALLCQYLEGIPLSLELAAAWTQVLTPAQMLKRLTQRSDLRALPRSRREPRHRSLWAAMEWSYHLLPPESQRFFASLSVFRGGWSAEAAEAVCFGEGSGFWVLGCRERTPCRSPKTQNLLEFLAQLRAHSLVLVDDGGVEMRYRMLETLREFAAEQLTPEEQSALARRHAAYFIALVEEKSRLSPTEQVAWSDRLEREHDNLRAALTWLLNAPEAEVSPQLVEALVCFWEGRCHFREGREWLAKLLSRGGASLPALRAAALKGAGRLAFFQDDKTAARSLLEESLALRRELGDRRGIADSLNDLGMVAHSQEDFTAAESLWTESMALWQELGNQPRVANALFNLAEARRMQGDYETARALYEKSLTMVRELEIPGSIAYALCGLGETLCRQGDLEQARPLLEESLAILRKLGNKLRITDVLFSLEALSLLQGDYAATRAHLLEVLSLSVELDHPRLIAYALEGFACLAAAQGLAERAARLFGAVEGLHETKGKNWSNPLHPDLETRIAAARAALGKKTFKAAWAQGRAMTLEQAVAYALADEG